MGKLSRYTTSFTPCPAVEDTDAFVEFLVGELDEGRIDLIAPTSDSVVFHTMSAVAALGGSVDVGHPEPTAVVDCLLKDRFASVLDRLEFPTPATAAPTSLDEARAFGDKVGYPLVAKPRTHIGVGVYRGTVFASEEELLSGFVPLALGDGHSTALAVEPDLAWPLLQEFIAVPDLEVISVSGFVDRHGDVIALDHSMKQRLWPPTLGIGTLFVALESQPFTEHATTVVRELLGSGIFEFEVLFDRRTGDYWGIDLNPRAFGQMTLDVARGNDLPRLWYEAATGSKLPVAQKPKTTPTRWQLFLPLAVDLISGVMRGPDRAGSLRELFKALGPSAVGAVADWRDPVPGLVFSREFLRHPGGLVRPFFSR